MTLPQPSFDCPSRFFLPVARGERRQQSRPVAIERRISLRRRDDRIEAGKGD